MHEPYIEHPGLPLCCRLKVEWHWYWFGWVWSAAFTRPRGLVRSDWFMRTRGANFTQVWLGPISVIRRAPWLEGPARTLHPELFKQ